MTKGPKVKTTQRITVSQRLFSYILELNFINKHSLFWALPQLPVKR